MRGKNGLPFDEIKYFPYLWDEVTETNSTTFDILVRKVATRQTLYTNSEKKNVIDVKKKYMGRRKCIRYARMQK